MSLEASAHWDSLHSADTADAEDREHIVTTTPRVLQPAPILVHAIAAYSRERDDRPLEEPAVHCFVCDDDDGEIWSVCKCSGRACHFETERRAWDSPTSPACELGSHTCVLWSGMHRQSL